MFSKLSKKVTESFVEHNIIRKEDYEIYEYGVQQGFMMVLNILTIVIIGVLFHSVIEITVLALSYLILRSYAGGYHCRTQLGCYVCSIILMVCMLIGTRVIPQHTYLLIIMTIIPSSIIYRLAPVEDENKPLDHMEIKVYGKRSRMIAGIEVLMTIILLVVGLNQYALYISIGLVAVSCMLILGKLRNRSVR